MSYFSEIHYVKITEGAMIFIVAMQNNGSRLTAA
jgi:hypothetical protein